jgi:hypothetical protein
VSAQAISGTYLQDVLGLDNNLDTSARAISGFIEAFQNTGEQAGDTASRIILGVETLYTALQVTGDTLAGLSAMDQLTIGRDFLNKLTEANVSTEQFAERTSSYYNTYFTDTERAARLAAEATTVVTASFDKLGVSMPETNVEFRDLVESLDLTTDSGRGAFIELMGISDAFNVMTQSSEELAAELEANRSNFVNSFYDEYKVAVFNSGTALKSVLPTFEKFGLAVPSTKQGFVALVEALINGGEQSAEAANALMGLSDAIQLVYGTADLAAENFDTVYKSLFPEEYEAERISAFNDKLREFGWQTEETGNKLGITKDQLWELSKSGQIGAEAMQYLKDNIDLFAKTASKASNASGLMISRAERGVGSGAVSQDWNEWINGVQRDGGMSETTKYTSIIDNLSQTGYMSLEASQMLTSARVNGTKEDYEKALAYVQSTMQGRINMIASFQAKLDDAMPRFVSEVEKDLSGAKTNAAKVQGAIDAALLSQSRGGTTFTYDGRTYAMENIDVLHRAMEDAKSVVDGIEKELEDSADFYDQYGINIALKKVQRAQSKLDNNKDDNFLLLYAQEHAVALSKLNDIVKPMIDEFIESFEISAELSEAADSIRDLFAGIEQDIPLTIEAFQDLYESGGLTADQIAGLALNLDDLGVIINGAQSLFDWLEPAEASEAALDRITDIFSDLGVELPDTKTALYDLIHSGALTSDQILVLVSHLQDLQTVFDETGEGAIDSTKEKLKSLFDALSDPMTNETSWNVLQNTFTDWGETLPTTSAALLELIKSGDLTSEQVLLLADNVDLVTSAYEHQKELIAEQIREHESLISSLESVASSVERVRKSIVDNIREINDQKVDLDAMRNSVFSGLTSIDPDQLAEAMSDAEEYRSELMSYYKDELSILEQRKGAIESASEAMLTWVDNMRMATGGAISSQQRLNNARSQYQTTLSAARAGDIDSMSDITSIADTYLDAAKATASDPVAYARAYGQVISQIEQLAMTEAEAQIEQVVNEIDALKSDIISSLTQLDNNLASAAEVLDGRIDDLTLLIEGLQTIDNATELTLMDMEARADETDRIIDELQKLVEITSKKETVVVLPSLPSYYDNQFASESRLIAQVKGFAEGGYHSGGLRLVGERGPELEVTGPSHITPNHSIASAFSEGNRDTVRELAALREELTALRLEQRRQHHESARYQRDTADALIKIDQLGVKTAEAV